MAQSDLIRNALKAGQRVLWYEIERTLGQGGFGITYVATDTNLHQQIALKEYLPTELAVRENGLEVHPVSTAQADNFIWGLDKFMVEARTLAHFDHRNIVKVYSVFEANNTAYMVMRYEDGMSLGAIFNKRKRLPERLLQHLIHPILDGLEEVHNAGFVHRDIKPDNIYLRQDASPVLLDFGSARMTVGSETHAMTSLVSPGYAPFEQYVTGSDKQGPWSDIYSLGATLYRGICGVQPQDATNRSEALSYTGNDVFVSALEVGRGHYSESFLRAVDAALCFRFDERPQSVAEWRAMFKAKRRSRKRREIESETAQAQKIEASAFDAESGAADESAPVVMAEPGLPPVHDDEAGDAPPQSRRRIVPALIIVAISVLVFAAYLLQAAPEAGEFRRAPSTPVNDAPAERDPHPEVETAPVSATYRRADDPERLDYEPRDVRTTETKQPVRAPIAQHLPRPTTQPTAASAELPRSLRDENNADNTATTNVAQTLAQAPNCKPLDKLVFIPAMRARSAPSFAARLIDLKAITLIGPNSGRFATIQASLQAEIELLSRELASANAAERGQLLLTIANMQALADHASNTLKRTGLLASAVVPMQYLINGELKLLVLAWRIGETSLSGAPAVFRAPNLEIIAAAFAARRGQTLSSDELKRSLLGIVLHENFQGSAFAVLKPGRQLLDVDIALQWQNGKPNIDPNVDPGKLFIYSIDGAGALLPISQRLATDASLGYHEAAVTAYRDTVVEQLKPQTGGSDLWTCIENALTERYRENWRELTASNSISRDFKLPLR